MGWLIVLVAVAAAFGVMLVVYGIVARDRAITEAETGGPSARVTYRTLADVREQLRRRFEPTGAPVWIASQQAPNALAADLASADLQLRPYEFRILQVVAAVVFALLAYARFGHRLRSFEAGLPRAMELIANSMKAGQSVAQSLGAVTENAGPPVDEEFRLAQREVELGASVENALGNMVKRMGSSDLRLIVMVITIQHAVGGDLPAILITLADTMRQRAEMREEIMAATAQSRASSLIITLLPVAAGGLLFLLVPDYFRPMFVNPLGWVILGLAATLLVIGNVIIRRITAIA